ncbi:hypothetical protein GCM10025868_25370 [Angustibacter aerolatus]|uniref:Mannitol dehydrogenase N-terminal domain-containing protein n=1 Tax=Angustibacter aerolatus TaxID=1162965 RepID=A0ABQ6JK91_9ACTN|nr:hypothetical protein [Angustibacter aerolatus]GMA87287.1 hypothetical protein GCM10025868_25370 [Angustibacter aerolatus]
MAVPTYDRSSVQVGIVHLGVGAFHRSHQAMYVDRLLQAGGAREWGIAGVGLMPNDVRMRDALDAQDGLYTLVVKHPDGRLEPRVIGSLLRYLFAADDPEAVLEPMAAPTTRIVSLTVTEGGYNIHPQTGEFDLRNPAVQADLADGAVPTTSFAFVVEAARRRRERGIEPFTVMSCDNIPGNGDVARRMFTAFAEAKDPALAEHLRTDVAWPNSMVDRITPVTSDHDREPAQRALRRRGRLAGRLRAVHPVGAGRRAFPLGRPRFEDVGAQAWCPTSSRTSS